LLSDDAERTDYEGDGLFALATKNGLNLSAYAKAYADMDGLSDEQQCRSFTWFGLMPN
jgi:hypothetical protein